MQPCFWTPAEGWVMMFVSLIVSYSYFLNNWGGLANTNLGCAGSWMFTFLAHRSVNSQATFISDSVTMPKHKNLMWYFCMAGQSTLLTQASPICIWVDPRTLKLSCMCSTTGYTKKFPAATQVEDICSVWVCMCVCLCRCVTPSVSNDFFCTVSSFCDSETPLWPSGILFSAKSDLLNLKPKWLTVLLYNLRSTICTCSGYLRCTLCTYSIIQRNVALAVCISISLLLFFPRFSCILLTVYHNCLLKICFKTFIWCEQPYCLEDKHHQVDIKYKNKCAWVQPAETMSLDAICASSN